MSGPPDKFVAAIDREKKSPSRMSRFSFGILQADAYSGYNELYDPSRSQGAITAALCWAHDKTDQCFFGAGGAMMPRAK